MMDYYTTRGLFTGDSQFIYPRNSYTSHTLPHTTLCHTIPTTEITPRLLYTVDNSLMHTTFQLQSIQYGVILIEISYALRNYRL